MSIDRREFILKSGVVVAGSTILGAAASARPAVQAAANSGYLVNRAPLAPAAFLRLPPGAVKATGWLETQLGYQLDGLNGRYQEISHFLAYDNTGWIHPQLAGWEEVLYWLRGYVDLGFVTGDAGVLSNVNTWINGILATQQSDGFFGPAALRTSLNGHMDPWPHMPLLQALRSFGEYSGDARIVPFLTKYFSYLNAQPTGVFSDGWGATRWGDTIEVVYWVYNQTGDAFLLDLVRRIHANSANWVGGLPTQHNVNMAQGFREPAQYAVLSGATSDRQATYDRYDGIQAAWGQFPGGGFAGDENARQGQADPRQGFETCGIVEYMLSHEILARITGDAVWGDRIEELAFNALPAALDPLGRSTHYVSSANSVDLNNVPKASGQFQNTFAMQSYMAGIDQYRCCPHNYGMGWPYFVEEMWLATPDGGLCAALYGPSKVTAKVANGKKVTITETTSYPFRDTIKLALKLSAPATFPLTLRIPAWCANPSIKVNGTPVSFGGSGARYVDVNRTWNDGDVVAIHLPFKATTKTWAAQHGAMSVYYGPLAMSLQIGENWVQTAGTAQWPQYDVHATTAWNYALVPGAPLTVSLGGDVHDPFKQANAPVRILASAQALPTWQADSEGVVTQMQDGPVAAATPVQQVTLVPMGAARLRITAFPQAGGTAPWRYAGAMFRLQNRNSGKVLGVDGMSWADSANVVQFADSGTSDHLWCIRDAGGGFVKLFNANSNKLLAVQNMSTADSAPVQQFADSGSADHLWQFVDTGDGYVRLRNAHSGKVLGVAGMSTSDSAQVVQFADNGSADHDWRIVPNGRVKLLNAASGNVLSVQNMSTADSAPVQQFADNGTQDHLWTFLPNADGTFRVANVHSGKVLGVAGMSTAGGAQVVQFADNGTADHLWRIRLVGNGPGALRLQNANSGLMLSGVAGAIDIEQFADNGSAAQQWTLV